MWTTKALYPLGIDSAMDPKSPQLLDVLVIHFIRVDNAGTSLWSTVIRSQSQIITYKLHTNGHKIGSHT